MRGRTNASNGGIFLNATTDDFEVATGNTIVAGDFVEYHYDPEIKPLVSTFGENSYLVDATTHTYIALFGDYPTLYTYIDNEITVVSTYQTASSCLIQLDATHYFIFNTTTKNVGLISCTTSAITLVDEAYSTSTVAGSFVRVNATTMVYLHNNSSYLFYATTDANYTSVTVAYKNIGVSSFSIAGATSTRIVLRSTTSSASAYTNNFMLYDPSTFTQADVFTITSYDSALNTFNNVVIDDRYLITYNLTKRSQGGTTYNNWYVGILDIVDKRLATRLLFDDISNSSSGVLSISPVNSQSEFIVSEFNTSQEYYLYWVKFDDALVSLTKSDYTTLNGGGAIYAFGTYAFARMINNQGYINLDTSSGKVEVGTLTDTVQEWSGGADPLGVAKQSGTAGDTIEVYIPQVNS